MSKSRTYCFQYGSLLFIFLLLANVQLVAAQNVQVTGLVKDSRGPVAGVSIREQRNGKALGQTGDQGTFKIEATEGAVLIFSCIGYKSKEIGLSTLAPTGQGTYNVNVELLPDDANDLDEVVVVGFGTQKKVNLTGAVGTVDAKAIANRPVRNATQALQGLVTGLNISQNNGSLESNPSINIRGIGTISDFSNASPLILIDGMEGSINVLNPQDIESISVLKDASASSIYGSRAAFGVILVTTKRGKAGKVQVNYNNNFRYSSPVLLPKMMDSYTFALYFNDAGINGGSSPHFTQEHLQRIKDYQEGKITASTIPNPTNPLYWGEGYAYGNDNVDWYKTMYNDNSFSHEHNISLNGGNEKTTYYLSGNFMDQKGMMRFNQDFYDRYTLTAKINTKLSDQIAINYSSRFLRDSYKRPAALTDGFYNDLGRQGWPTLPLYDPNGFLFSSPSPALLMQDGGADKTTKDWLYQQLQLVLEPIKGWRTFAEFNYRIRNDFRHWDSQQAYNHDVNGVPYLYKNSSNVYEYGFKENYFNTNIYSEYATSFAEKHHLKAMLGFQAEQTKYRDLSAMRNGIIVPSLPTINTTSGIDADGRVVAPTVSGQYQNWATAGFFGRLNYDYDGRYLLEANLRRDASSRFRSDSRWGWFPSVSGGWNVARETFWTNNIKAIETFKFRASYGELGNQDTKVWYPTYVTMPVGTANGGWLINNARPNTSGAPGIVSSTLTWETIKSLNFGLDWGAFNNRLTGSFDWFTRKTLGMVQPGVELPVILGTGVPPTNNTDLKTVGFELEVAWADRLKNGMGYNLRFLLSDNQSTVLRYANQTGTLDSRRKGQKLNEIWGYETIGIAKTQAEMDAHLASLPNGGQDPLGAQWGAGDIMYRDLNGDGVINRGSNTINDPGDRRIIGNSTPRYNMGFDINLDYKGFDFRAFFQGVLKRDFWQGSYFFWGATSNKWWSTGFVEHTDYFRDNPDHPLGVNTDAYYPKPNFSSGRNQEAQTGYLQDASYIRLKNLQIGYTFPNTWTSKFKCQSLRIYASGENLWTRTKTATMFDPETIDGGSNGSVYPLSKVFSFGLSVIF
ncbi:SusC/RagA family TonB-linked outer membrane protein [Olivibacter jilunii]|uniref:SusC/RagA family TonB-linked outer membrane protein n=1 Tax=Olivibacter jilunii TaxID=985016 RepID=UPI003F156231